MSQLHRTMSNLCILLFSIVVLLCFSSCDVAYDDIPNYFTGDYVFAMSDVDAEGSYAYIRFVEGTDDFILLQYDTNPAIVFWGKYRYETKAYKFSEASGLISFYDVDSNNTNLGNALISDTEGAVNEYEFYWYLTEKGEKRIEMETTTPNLSLDLFNGRQIPDYEFDGYLPEGWDKEEGV